MNVRHVFTLVAAFAGGVVLTALLIAREAPNAYAQDKTSSGQANDDTRPQVRSNTRSLPPVAMPGSSAVFPGPHAAPGEIGRFQLTSGVEGVASAILVDTRTGQTWSLPIPKPEMSAAEPHPLTKPLLE